MWGVAKVGTENLKTKVSMLHFEACISQVLRLQTNLGQLAQTLLSFHGGHLPSCTTLPDSHRSVPNYMSGAIHLQAVTGAALITVFPLRVPSSITFLNPVYLSSNPSARAGSMVAVGTGSASALGL
jgi:hypothetical protein